MNKSIGNSVGIILQARMGSTRLPGKILLPLGYTTVLGWILDRLEQLPYKVVVATTENPQDDVVIKFCDNRSTFSFRGHEQNVLDRYLGCARKFHFTNIIRLTADNPFPDVEEILALEKLHLSGNYDYTHSFNQLPIGVAAEIFTIKSLETSRNEGVESHHQEHVNEFILENPTRFCTASLDTPKNKWRPDLRLTIDTKEDYEFISECVSHMKDPFIGTETIIKYCSLSA